jgi:pyrroloquinoline-quinone synthase
MHRLALDQLFDEALSGRRLLTHLFYRRWEAGQLQRWELAAYAAQYRHFEQALPDVLEAVASGLDAGPARASVQANLDDERGAPAPHLDLFDTFAEAVGAEPAPPTAATAALVGLHRSLAVSDPVAALAALAAYESQAPGIATSKALGLRAHYGLHSDQTRFWDVHGTMDADHADWTLDALSALGGDEQAVRRGARTAADAWWAFLDERQAEAPALTAC